MVKAADSKTKASGTTRNSRAKTTTSRKTTPKKTTAATTRAKKAAESEKEEVKTPAKKTTSRSTRKTTATKSTGTKTTSTRKTTPKAKTTTTAKPKATTSRSTAKRTSTKKTAETTAEKPKTTTRSSRTKKAEETKTTAKKPAAKKTTSTRSKSSGSTASSKRKTTTSRSTAKSRKTTKPKTQTRRTPARKPKEEPQIEAANATIVEETVEVTPIENSAAPVVVNEPFIEPAVSEESLTHEVEEHKAPVVDELESHEEESSYGDEEIEVKDILSEDEAFDVIEREIPDCIKFNDCTRFRYIEGENLIVKDRYDNKYRFWINHSDNEILEPEVELFYAVLPFDHKKGDVIDTKRLVILENKYTGKKVLEKLETFSAKPNLDEESDVVNDTEIKSPDAADRITPKDSEESHGAIRGAGAILSAFHETSSWAKKDSKKTISIVSVLAFLIIAIGIGGYEYHSGKPEFGPVKQTVQSGKQSAMDVAGAKPQYVNLSPSETHIKSLNTIISEINRIQGGLPVKGKVGSEIIQRNFTPAQLESLKNEIQKQVNALIQEEGEMNAGMGPVGGKDVPFASQEDRFGISNVPTTNSWSYVSGAKLGIPPGSQKIGDVKDLSEFGLKVH